jgi:type I restriction enzyme M protein
MIGQYPTPDAVARLVYRLSGARRGQRVMDPSCGDGVFVRCAPAGCAVFICERDERYRAALERLLPPQRLVLGDALTRLDHLWGTFDLAVGNPPFSAQSHLERRPEVLRQFDLGTGRKSQCLEVLFLELFLKLAKPGGRIAIILPDGPLANRPFHYVRRWLLERARVETIVSLPRGVFANTTAKTNILIAKKYGTIQTTEYTEHTEGGIVDASRVTQMGVAVLPCVPCLPWFPALLSPDSDWRPEAFTVTSPKALAAAIRLGDLFHLRTGFARYGAQRTLFDSSGPDRILLIRAKNFAPHGGLRLDRECAYIARHGPMFRDKAIVHPGEILFVRVGAGCCGRVAVVPPSLVAQADDWIHILTPKAGVDPQAVVDWLNGAEGRAALRRLAKGVGTLSISKSSLAEMRMPDSLLAPPIPTLPFGGETGRVSA